MWGRGTVLGNRYTLTERLGAGGMGEVWQADDRVLERRVAVKILLPALMADERFAARFRREAKVLAALSHPGIVRVHDYGETEGGGEGEAGGGGTGSGTRLAYIVMELVDGRPLDAVLAAEGPLPPQRVLDITALALDALHAAHRRGIVHRDIKPSNLMLRADGQVTVTDFGIAHSTDGTRLTASHAVLGTARYIAPEQAEGGPAVAASDLYSLGAVGYELLTGRAPFTGDKVLEIILKHIREPAPELPGELPEPVRAFVARALRKDPGERYADAAEMAVAARTAAAAVAAAGAVAAGSAAAGSAAAGAVSAAAAPAAVPPAATTRFEDAAVTAGEAGLTAPTVPGAAFASGQDQIPDVAPESAKAVEPRAAGPVAAEPASAASARAAVVAPGAQPAGAPAASPQSPVPARSPSAAPAPSAPPESAPSPPTDASSWWKRHRISAALLALALVVASVATVLFIASGPGEADADNPTARQSGEGKVAADVPPGDSPAPGAAETPASPGPGSPSPSPGNGTASPGASGAPQGGTNPPAGGIAPNTSAPPPNGGPGNTPGGPTQGASGGASGGPAPNNPKPATSQPPAKPSTPPGCGGTNWGQITSVRDGLPLGLAASAPAADGAVIMGGTTQYGWVYSRPNSWANFDACNLDGRALTIVANYPDSTEVTLAGDFALGTNWTVTPASTPGAHLLQDYMGKTCLTNNGGGARVTMATCTPGNKSQEWRIP
ncbi:serine/threonine protein kinase [Streptomycetaceae bacterium NBC_01309]